ncbi:sigma-70 family RNA polymerase sigma factor [Corallococcus exercitus]|uniref:sigma-70 family RNA polymerase sigma factor n=1 Tax=Corallococcus exercitus TaxID=2316736 RepID=UPI001FC95C6D|nr:sigma-70 family RNA polymerase sigma factor [Corallococcus exercitus]
MLERLLQETLASAHTRWSGDALPPELFMRHLAERLPEASPESPLSPLLGQLALEELYLACACVHGVAGATEAFEQHYLSKLPGLLAYLKHPPALMDDVCQVTRVKLLVRMPEEEPRIKDYTGRGALLSWVRVTAIRVSIKLSAADKPAPEEDVGAVLDALPAPGSNAELELIRQSHQAEFQRAVREAFSTLSPDERHLLRLYCFDRLSTTELGALLRVNQSTVSRWLKSARQTVYSETRRLLRERLGLSTQGFESFLAVLGSQLDVSISQLFGDGGGPPRG